jgi:predicted dehydrogenase
VNNRIINVGIIGAGQRSNIARLLFEQSENIRLKGIFDPDKSRAAERIGSLKIKNPVNICSSYQELTSDPEIDWIMIFSPNIYHCKHIINAIDNQKHVFTEKPLATTIQDCKTIFEACKKSKCKFATGFVLRYSPLYRKTKELLDAGAIGNILSIEANENLSVELGSYIMRNWRRKRKFSGPYILEKCCHDLDLLNWFTNSIPKKVASFGGLNFFKSENDCFVEKYRGADGESPFTSFKDPAGEKSPFTSQKDIVDNQVAIIEYRNNVRATFQSVVSNANHERRMYIAGTEGTMIIELFSSQIILKKIGDQGKTIFNMSQRDGHGGGDRVIMRELSESMLKETLPVTSGQEGLESAITALAIDEARNTNSVVDLNAIWESLNK